MYDCYFTLRSVTPGQKGREALRRAGLRCRLLRAPREIAPGGCAYALTVERGDAAAATALLERSGVRTEGVWLRLPDGSFERSGL